MIIGVSGKIGSGKDVTGKIIQYLASHCYLQSSYTCLEYVNAKHVATKDCDWKIVKFADKLKECISIITGISREDLEKSEVKNRVLGEEWIRYSYAIGHTVSNTGERTMLTKQCSKEIYEYERGVNWQTAYKHEYTVRELLQLFGTEVGRQIHSDFWVNALFSEYKIIGVKGWVPSYSNPDNSMGEESEPIYSNWIITDMRFPNELQAVKNRDGITIRLNRNFYTGVDNHLATQSHPSETALDNATFDYKIDNNGNIEDLIVMVKEILINEKIL